jgi:16S rRNA (cytosine967-C5)-methyltransferase
MVKLYKNLVSACVQALGSIFTEQKYADDVVSNLLQSNKQWGSRDRQFLASTIYDTVRNFRLYKNVADSTDIWKVLAAKWMVEKIDLPEWPEFADTNVAQMNSRYQEVIKNPAIKESYPDWIYDLCIEELGPETAHAELAAMNKAIDVYLRVNTLKTTRNKAKLLLEEEGAAVESIEGYNNALRLTTRRNLSSTVCFRDGLIEVQDLGSQQIGAFLQAEPADFVIDACAGAGGKTLQIACDLQNRGTIAALDIHESKLTQLRKRAHRAEVTIIETHIADANTRAYLYQKADKLLLDVPCSGLGVIKRNADTKWKLTPEKLAELQETQWEILSRYTEMLKPGGELVYATCSILPSENEKQVRKLLDAMPDKFKLLEEKRISPAGDTDGYYMARLSKLN